MKKIFDSAVEKIGLSGIFLVAVIFLYSIAFFVSGNVFENAVAFSVSAFLKIFPVLIFVFFLVFLVNKFVDAKEAKKHLGEGSGLKAWVIVVVGGIISSGPIYMWYPLLADLKEKGMKDSLIATFLYSRAIKIPFLPLMIFYFGLHFTLIFNILILFFSLLNGFATRKLTKYLAIRLNTGERLY